MFCCCIVHLVSCIDIFYLPLCAAFCARVAARRAAGIVGDNGMGDVARTAETDGTSTTSAYLLVGCWYMHAEARCGSTWCWYIASAHVRAIGVFSNVGDRWIVGRSLGGQAWRWREMLRAYMCAMVVAPGVFAPGVA